VISARALKVTAVLPAAEVLAFDVRGGVPRVELAIVAGGHVRAANINAKSVRRAKAAIEGHGPGGVACILQGRLIEGRIEDAGLSAQPKATERNNAKESTNALPG
jgi:hypothetical protein